MTQLSGFRITQPLFFQQNAPKKTAHLSGFDPNSGLTLRQPRSAVANRGMWGMWGGRQPAAIAVDYLQPIMPNTERYQNRIELLQGTLDMLILQTLQWGRSTGMASARRYAPTPGMCCGWRPARF